jgi:hypothetical protein
MRCIRRLKRLFCGGCSLSTSDVWTLLSDVMAMVLIVALAALGTLAYGLC